MGQVLPVFAHCKEAPSTASSTPDSTDGGNDDSDFRELHTAREFSEEEEEETTSQDWGTPRELTFSYIAFEAGGNRRDSVHRRPRPSGRSEPREPGPSGLGDSLESIPSLSQSPEPERRAAQEGPPQAELRLRLDQLAWESGLAASEDSASSPSEEEEDDEDDEGRPEPRLAGEVAELLYWRDTRTSGVVFTGIMVSLLCLLHFSIVSVASHLALALLAITISLRVYHKALQAVHRGDGANPFQAYLDVDLSLSREQTARYTEQITDHVVSGVTLLRHLFLVEDLVDSLKLALLFYILTFVGAVFNGLTLLILGVISAFTFPLLYRQHQAQIDQYVGLVNSQLSYIKAKCVLLCLWLWEGQRGLLGASKRLLSLPLVPNSISILTHPLPKELVDTSCFPTAIPTTATGGRHGNAPGLWSKLWLGNRTLESGYSWFCH
ncbi:reticulon-2 isoform X2 [Phascolarctos cinereus]